MSGSPTPSFTHSRGAATRGHIGADGDSTAVQMSSLASLLPLLPLLFVQLASAAPAPSAPSVAPKPYVGRSLPTQKPKVGVRLRMALKMVLPNDAAEAGASVPPSISDLVALGNSEDEIYYNIAALPLGTGAAQIKTIRPSGSPDVWEMGYASLIKQHRVLFEGELSADDRAYFAVAIGEQDNAQAAAISFMLGDIAGFIGNLDTPPGVSVPSSFGPVAKATVERIHDKGDDVIGMFVVTVGGGRKLSVDGSANTKVKILESSKTEVLAELSGGGARYHVRLWVEGLDTPRPATRKVVGKTSDKCSEQDLWVVGNGGQVLLHKGETKEIPRGAGRFTWYCDGSEESAVADPGTDVISARRASTGRNIDWIFLREDPATPDFTD